jgi:sugar lactone lactonase YvrE
MVKRGEVLEIQVLTAPFVGLGEGPIWDVEEQRLYWVDFFEGNYFRSTADGREVQVRKFPLQGTLSSLALRAGGGAIVTLGTQILLFDTETGETEQLIDVAETGVTFFNDSKVDRQGRFVTGTVDLGLLDHVGSEPVGQIKPPCIIYRVDADRSVHQLADGIGFTNGPAFSPDGSVFFVNDSWAQCIYAYDYDTVTGAASNRRVVTKFDEPGVVPDGATVDEEGFIWVAAFHGGEIRRYAPDGALDRRIAMPVAKLTSVAFGGENLDVLFVTTMGSTLVPGRDASAPVPPLGGSLFAVHGLGVRGVPEMRFAG